MPAIPLARQLLLHREDAPARSGDRRYRARRARSTGMEGPARETPRGAELRAAVLSDPEQCRSRGLARSDSECRGGGKRTDADKRESAESGVAAGSLFKQEDACMRAEMIADGSLSMNGVFFDPECWYEIDTPVDLANAERILEETDTYPEAY